MVNSLYCAFCHEKKEFVQHLFLKCKFVALVWSCLRWIGILFFFQYKDLKSHFESFFLVNVNVKQNLVWKGVWTTIVWSIWDQRNRIVFKQGKIDGE